jgi:hypothetical protein
MDKFWVEEVCRVTKAFKDRRVDPGDIDRWKNIKESLTQTIAGLEVWVLLESCFYQNSPTIFSENIYGQRRYATPKYLAFCANSYPSLGVSVFTLVIAGSRPRFHGIFLVRRGKSRTSCPENRPTRCLHRGISQAGPLFRHATSRV